jgi:hypothetical protein
MTPATLGAKGGTIWREMTGKFYLKISELKLLLGFFYMPKI